LTLRRPHAKPDGEGKQAMTVLQAPSRRRVLGASLVGTAVEFYDFYIYATAASLVFGPLFFPAASASAQLLLSYATFAVAFVARPVGAMVFGHFGDRIGRKSTLVASLLIMGGSTMAIGLLPTYATIGGLAPLLLCVLRFGQGFGLGGEWGGATLLAVENAPPHLRARFGMMPQLGAPAGFIMANGLFLLLGLILTPDEFRAWGWRLPFLASAVLVAIGLWVRLKITETPAFRAALAAAPPERVPVAMVLRNYGKEALGGMFAVVACYAVFYLSTVFMLGYATTKLGVPRESVLAIQLVAILFMAAGTIAAGWLSDTFDARRVLIAGCLGSIVLGFLMAPLVGGGSLTGIFVFLVLALSLMGLVYGPLGAWLPGLFPPRVRYSGVSLSFNVGGVLGGALTPIIAQALAGSIGRLEPVGFCLSGAALVSLIALLPIKRPPLTD
jgi:MFS family permease